MGFDSLKRERQEIYKEKKTDRQLKFIMIFTAIVIIFLFATNMQGSIADMFVSTPFYQAKHYPVLLILELICLIGVFMWWKGNGFNFPVILIRRKGILIYPVFTRLPVLKNINFYTKKIPVLKQLFFFLNYNGKEGELTEFFYQAPVQTDELKRAKNIIFTDITTRNFFKEDYNDIIGLFKGKDFKEKEETFNDLISIIEGVFKEYKENGKSYLHINEKDLKSPFKEKNMLDAAVFDRKNGEVHFSTKQMLDVFNDFCNMFERFLENYSTYKTRIAMLYKNELNNKEVKKKIMVYFKLVMFRRLLKLYMNIPAGWVVVRLEDYTARAIISSVDRESLVIVNKTNSGEVKGFPDCRMTRMFLLLYHYFFTKTEYADIFKNVFEILTPDKTAAEIEDFILKNRRNLEIQLDARIYPKGENDANSD